MKKLLVLSICTSLVMNCSSCGMYVEQQPATHENEFAVTEQVIQKGHESENTAEKNTEAEDVMSRDSIIIETGAHSGIIDGPTEKNYIKESSTSDTKQDQYKSMDGGKDDSSRMNTEPQNTVSTTNDSVETTDSHTISITVTEPYYQRRKAEYDAVVGKAISDKPYHDVIKSTVSDDILFRYLDNMMNPWRSNVDTPVTMNNRYKIELIREIDDKRMYSIQIPESGGAFYSFYLYGGLNCTAYITKSLFYADYNAIKVGSSINDVISIEPATQAYINRNKMLEEQYNSGEWSGEFTQHIILRDGLLKLTYSRSEGTYIVDQIDFFDNFKESIIYDREYPWIYDYSIWTQDYPQ